jgi:D-alanine-D-alanine ligase
MKNVGLFCGGFSSEYDISLKSAQTIYDSFPKGYSVFKIEVTSEDWFHTKNSEKIVFDKNNGRLKIENKSIQIDFAIICIHGDPGENGKIQAYLDLLNIPYLNSNAQASSLSFDKFICNQFLNSCGFKTAASQRITKRDSFDTDKLIEKLDLPIFIKPTDSGSSFGISKVYKAADIVPAVKKAFKEGDTIIAESFLDGIELTCAVFRSKKELIALPITQISTDNDFFDFDAKYNGNSKEETPANIEDELTKQIQETSKAIYSALQLSSVARIDYIVVKGTPYIIEVNTIPGFSKASIVPQMLKCAGIKLEDFWSMIIEAELNN